MNADRAKPSNLGAEHECYNKYVPLYDYRCRKCGETFEVKQKFSDLPLAVHEECGGEVDRLISVPALQFKGSGWYITDYARGKSSDKPAGTTDTKSETPKTETKPETKPAPAASPAE